jgi:flagellar biosynthesis protein FliP
MDHALRLLTTCRQALAQGGTPEQAVVRAVTVLMQDPEFLIHLPVVQMLIRQYAQPVVVYQQPVKKAAPRKKPPARKAAAKKTVKGTATTAQKRAFAQGARLR